MLLPVSIIIINWNQRDLLIECLHSINRQTEQAHDITVVDNGSTDGSVQMVGALFPEVTVIALPENVGFAIANNLALRKCRSKYIALINNDAMAKPDWLKNLVDAMETHPEAGMAASKMVYDDDPTVIDRVGDGYSIAVPEFYGAGEICQLVLPSRKRSLVPVLVRPFIVKRCWIKSVFLTKSFF